MVSADLREILKRPLLFFTAILLATAVIGVPLNIWLQNEFLSPAIRAFGFAAGAWIAARAMGPSLTVKRLLLFFALAYTLGVLLYFGFVELTASGWRIAKVNGLPVLEDEHLTLYGLKYFWSLTHISAAIFVLFTLFGFWMWGCFKRSV